MTRTEILDWLTTLGDGELRKVKEYADKLVHTRRDRNVWNLKVLHVKALVAEKPRVRFSDFVELARFLKSEGLYSKTTALADAAKALHKAAKRLKRGEYVGFDF